MWLQYRSCDSDCSYVIMIWVQLGHVISGTASLDMGLDYQFQNRVKMADNVSLSCLQVYHTIILEYAKSVTPKQFQIGYCGYIYTILSWQGCSFPWQGFKVGEITARLAAFQKVCTVLLVSVPFILSQFCSFSHMAPV